jgi:carboxyl-terminal processing protease
MKSMWITINKRLQSTIFFVLTVMLFVNMLCGYNAYATAKKSEPKDNPYKSISTLVNVIQLLRQNYVDGDKVTYKKLINGALKGMLHELDPFSAYVEPKPYKNMREQTDGKFGGIGVHISWENKLLKVVSPMEDTPGFKAGIKPGDIITKIEGKETRKMSLGDCVKLLRGRPGSKVAITIYRKDGDMTKDLVLERAEIKVSGIKGAKIIGDDVAYIRLTQFVGTTSEKLDEALYKLKKKGFKSLILDLRGNPGGLLTTAIQVCSRFLKEGELVVFTEGRRASQRKEFHSLDCEKFLDFPMAILVDKNSASAAEIVSGCLQDHKRAFLVGEQTFGKGSVQTVIPLANECAVKFTTAKYYTPSEKVIHENGIKPDIEVPLSVKKAYKLAQQRARYPGVVRPKGKQWMTDTQLQRAVEILKGVNLYSENRKD